MTRKPKHQQGQGRLAFDRRGPRRSTTAKSGDTARPAPHNRSATSKVAAGLISERAPALRVRVYNWIAGAGHRGATIYPEY
jgi:hypothetical protein